jgi:hypothetical protein
VAFVMRVGFKAVSYMERSRLTLGVMGWKADCEEGGGCLDGWRCCSTVEE